MNVSTIASAIFDPPAPRWKSYGCTHRGRMDAWVTPEELARIDAGVTSGTIETRVVPDQIGKIHQWRTKLPSNPQPSVTVPASSQNSGA